MTSMLPRRFIDRVHAALLRSFWRKRSLKHFLRNHGIVEEYLAGLDGSAPKREWLDRLLPDLEETEEGRVVLLEMARSLARQTSFPDLEHFDDSPAKIATARASVARLKEAFREMNGLEQMRRRLDGLAPLLGTEEGSFHFQEWFNDLMDLSWVEAHRRRAAPDGERDGLVTIAGTSYLVELRFGGQQVDLSDIALLCRKISSQPGGGRAIMVSMSGYTPAAIAGASSQGRGALLLLDYSHVYLVLHEVMSFPEVVRRIERHAACEGQAFVSVSKLSQ